MYAICRTADCANNGIGIDVGSLTGTNEDTGETYTISDVACGECGQPITDLAETAPPVPPITEELNLNG